MAEFMQITVTPLEAAAFAPFGQVLEHDSCQRQQDFPSAFETDGRAPNASLSLIRVTEAARFPVALERLERHPHSAQTFIPLEGARFLVVVCGSDLAGAPDLSTLRAFETRSGQIVTFGRSVWHKGITALTPDAVFAMTMLKTQNGVDTEFASVEPALTVRI